LKLWDCERSKLVEAAEDAPYVALSYVWGKLQGPSEQNQEKPGSELEMPRTIQDAILVTQELGFRYLWFDKYCINQDDSGKHEQIQQMDKIYKNAEVTLVAAAGQDAEHGLPGVGETPRNAQVAADYGKFYVFSTISNTHDTILSSTWNTRGWTFQEAALSRRRLVFTQDEVYFECCNMNCFESIPPTLSLIHTGGRYSGTHKFLHSGILSGAISSRFSDQGLLSTSTWDENELLSRYSRKALTKPTDRLNAFTGIMKRIEESYNYRHYIWGIQCSSLLAPKEALSRFVKNLMWAHGGGNGVKLLQSPGRKQWTKVKTHQRVSTPQYKAPSWSWAGWTGGIFFPFQDSPSQEGGITGVHGITLELENQATLNLEELFANPLKMKSLSLSSQEVSLHLDIDVVPPNAIKLNPDSKVMSINTCSLEFYLCDGPGRSEELYELLQQERCELLFIYRSATTWGFLVIRRMGEFYMRIGVCKARITFIPSTFICAFASLAEPPEIKRKLIRLR
jgi:hypothetical protein